MFGFGFGNLSILYGRVFSSEMTMSIPLPTEVTESPVITIAMPVFNAGGTLRSAVLSLVNQSFFDWELLLIDDGSRDNAVEDLTDIADSRIRVISDGKNKGLAARLNEAIDLARGEFFARMDHDDISHPERFSKQLARLKADSSLDLVGSRCVTVSERNEILGVLPGGESHEDICRRPWLGFYLPHPTWLGRTAWFRQHRYATPGPYCCEDQEFLLRTHSCSRFHVLPDYLLAYRLRDRFSFAKAWRTRRTLLKIQCEYFISKGNYWHACLAQVVCLLRIAKDIFTPISHSSRSNGDAQRSGALDPNTLHWYQIIDELEKKGRLPLDGAKPT